MVPVAEDNRLAPRFDTSPPSPVCRRSSRSHRSSRSLNLESYKTNPWSPVRFGSHEPAARKMGPTRLHCPWGAIVWPALSCRLLSPYASIRISKPGVMLSSRAEKHPRLQSQLSCERWSPSRTPSCGKIGNETQNPLDQNGYFRPHPQQCVCQPRDRTVLQPYAVDGAGRRAAPERSGVRHRDSRHRPARH